MDRFEKELHACSRLVRDAKHEDDREFWQQAAQRWKALLEDYREPPVSGEKGRARDKTVGEI